MPSLTRHLITALAALVTALVMLPLAVAPGLAVAASDDTGSDDTPSFTKIPASIPGAAQALHRAEAAVTGRSTTADLTVALRDLAVRLPEYSGAQRVLAELLLARPNGGTKRNENAIGAAWPGAEAPLSPECSVTPPICVHWTNSGADRPPAADIDNNGKPDQVDQTLAVMEEVWQTEVGSYGYRAPLTDELASKDNDGVNFDVYLSDIGGGGYYGYCAIDDSRAVHFDRAGYCVLDDDFAAGQFPNNSPVENLQVTAAHEFFHAIQFGYDAFEDGWFMEGTAAWIEDEVYPDVNDNRQYLRASQMVHPERPLDTSNGLTVYGSWGFFRYLSNSFGQGVVRAAWERADGASNAAPDDYSLQAVGHAIAARDASLGDVFGDYARANLAPGEYYDEGRTYPSPSVYAKRLGGSTRSTGWLGQRVDHMAIAYRAARPTGKTRSHQDVRITVDGPRRSTGTQARVLVKYETGSYAVRNVPLNRFGDGAVTVDFGRREVQRTTVALVNASAHFDGCFRFRTQYSCGGGTPAHDHLAYLVKFTLR